MNDLLSMMARHGYALTFAIVLAEALGLPLPISITMVAAGAAVASHTLAASGILLAALAAFMIGDSVQFFLGRYMGWALLGFLCRLSMNPETCILRSAEAFYKYGRITLLFIKFVPGVSTMSAPLAGSMKMKATQFLQLDFLGACFYILAYMGAGYLFRDFVIGITQGLESGSRAVAFFLVILLVAFAAYRTAQYVRFRVSGAIPRVGVEQIALRLASEGKNDVILADVRSHGYYDPDAKRIAGSIRIEPNRLAEELKTLPHDKDIYLYCT